MPKSRLKPPLDLLEEQVIETLLAGLKEWRPDLDYPESYSDMQACARALLRMFNVQRRPISIELPIASASSPFAGRERVRADFVERLRAALFGRGVLLHAAHVGRISHEGINILAWEATLQGPDGLLRTGIVHVPRGEDLFSNNVFRRVVEGFVDSHAERSNI